MRECARCGKEKRDEDLQPCLGCGDLICGRYGCGLRDYENLHTRDEGWVCLACAKKREMVPRPGAGKGAGSGAGVEAVERSRYYLYEATLELEARLRGLAVELAERIATQVEERANRLGEKLAAGTTRQIGVAGEKLEEALVRAARRIMNARMAWIALAVLLANGALTLGIVLALR